jgi:hypothetical protein
MRIDRYAYAVDRRVIIIVVVGEQNGSQSPDNRRCVKKTRCSERTYCTGRSKRNAVNIYIYLYSFNGTIIVRFGNRDDCAVRMIIVIYTGNILSLLRMLATRA